MYLHVGLCRLSHQGAVLAPPDRPSLLRALVTRLSPCISAAVSSLPAYPVSPRTLAVFRLALSLSLPHGQASGARSPKTPPPCCACNSILVRTRVFGFPCPSSSSSALPCRSRRFQTTSSATQPMNGCSKSTTRAFHLSARPFCRCVRSAVSRGESA